MGLTQSNAVQSLARVFAQLTLGDAKEGEYVHAILEACGWMMPQRFEEVCRVVAGEMAGRLPPVKQYKVAYNALAEEKRWTEPPRKTCPGCDGVGLVMGRYLHARTNAEYDAARPCPLCRGPSEIKPELQDIPSRDQTLEDIRLMSPASARYILEKVEAGRVKYGDPHLLALMERAAADGGRGHAESAFPHPKRADFKAAVEAVTPQATPEEAPTDWEAIP